MDELIVRKWMYTDAAVLIVMEEGVQMVLIHETSNLPHGGIMNVYLSGLFSQ
jgi:hypothetical protein